MGYRMTDNLSRANAEIPTSVLWTIFINTRALMHAHKPQCYYPSDNKAVYSKERLKSITASLEISLMVVIYIVRFLDNNLTARQ